MARIPINPVLNYKDSTDMYVINSHQAPAELPIMSFQTNKNGTFNPLFILPTGVLRWNINGVDYITNSPSISLTGLVVDVYVYANTFIVGDTCSGASFANLNIMGNLDFTWTNITGNIVFRQNSGLQNVYLRSSNNTTGIISGYQTGVLSLDLSNTTLNNNTSIDLNSNTSMEVITFKQVNQTTSALYLNGCKLTSLDLTYVSIGGQFWCHQNTNLSSITFRNILQITARIQMYLCKFTTIDYSFIRFTNALLDFSRNATLTSVTFRNDVNSIYELNGYSCNFSDINLQYIYVTGIVRLYSNANLTNIAYPAFSQFLTSFRIDGCSLPISKIDELFSLLNTYFTANTPTRNLTVNTSGGTNASPTGGANNTDILNLVSVFSAAGFTFLFTIN